MSIQGYRVIAYTQDGEMMHPHRLDVYLQFAEADKRKRMIERAWIGYDWFGRCDIKRVWIDHLANQKVIGVSGRWQTIWKLRGRGLQIYGEIQIPSKDQIDSQERECLAVWYHPEIRKWYLMT